MTIGPPWRRRATRPPLARADGGRKLASRTALRSRVRLAIAWRGVAVRPPAATAVRRGTAHCEGGTALTVHRGGRKPNSALLRHVLRRIVSHSSPSIRKLCAVAVEERTAAAEEGLSLSCALSRQLATAGAGCQLATRQSGR